MSRFTIVIPVYNEAGILEKNVNEIIRHLKKGGMDFEIIITEDGSTDGTDKIASEIAKSSKFVTHIHSDKRLGRGRATEIAIRKAKYNTVVYMDADLATDLVHIKELVSEIEQGYDMVVGSRLLDESSVQRPLRREIASRAFSHITRLFFRDGIRDHQCGFKAFNKRKISKVIDSLNSKHWFWDTELIVRSHIAKLKIKEIPIKWEEKKKSGSKVNLLYDSVYMASKLVRFKTQLVRER